MLSEQRSRRLHPINTHYFSCLTLEDLNGFPSPTCSSSRISSSSLQIQDVTTFKMSEKNSSEKIPEWPWKLNWLGKSTTNCGQAYFPFLILALLNIIKQCKHIIIIGVCEWPLNYVICRVATVCTLSSAGGCDRAKSWRCRRWNVACQTSKRDLKNHALWQNLSRFEHLLLLTFFPLFRFCNWCAKQLESANSWAEA